MPDLSQGPGTTNAVGALWAHVTATPGFKHFTATAVTLSARLSFGVSCTSAAAPCPDARCGVEVGGLADVDEPQAS
jgi:hypothetical protein